MIANLTSGKAKGSLFVFNYCIVTRYRILNLMGRRKKNKYEPDQSV